jgi:hypothetical protein
MDKITMDRSRLEQWGGTGWHWVYHQYHAWEFGRKSKYHGSSNVNGNGNVNTILIFMVPCATIGYLLPANALSQLQNTM